MEGAASGRRTHRVPTLAALAPQGKLKVHLRQNGFHYSGGQVWGGVLSPLTWPNTIQPTKAETTLLRSFSSPGRLMSSCIQLVSAGVILRRKRGDWDPAAASAAADPPEEPPGVRPCRCSSASRPVRSARWSYQG